MNCLPVFFTVLASAMARLLSSEHGNFDIDKLIKSPKDMRLTIDCFLELGECDENTIGLKQAIPVIVQGSCAQCSDTERYFLKRYLDTLRDHYYRDFEAFLEKYDPDGIYLEGLIASISDA